MITRPPSGSTISQAHIGNAFTELLTLLNGQGPTTQAPGALGPHHLPSLVVGKDQTILGGAVTVNTAPATIENAANIIATWQDPAGFYVNNGGAGYVLPTCTLLYWTCFRFSNFAAAPSLDHQLWANLYYVRAGADQTTLLNSRMVYGQTAFQEAEEGFTIFHVVPFTAGTLDRIGVRFALNRGSSAGAVPNCTIDAGNAGFIAFYRPS